MTTFVVTLMLTLLLALLVVFSLICVRTPRYRVERENIIALLELVVAGRATVNDWAVFVGVPIRQNPELEAIRLRCIEIEKHEYLGTAGARPSGHLFTRRGIAALTAILRQLQAETPR